MRTLIRLHIAARPPPQPELTSEKEPQGESSRVAIRQRVLMILSYAVSPAMLVWGWTRWGIQPKLKTIPSILSLIGFVFATASATLAVSSVMYAHFHYFSYYDPLLLRIFRCGTLLSLAGILFGLSGVWRQRSLRWHAPICALGTLAFWILAAEGE